MLQDLLDNNLMIFKLLEIPQNDQQLFEKGLDKLSHWSFDAITYHQMLQHQGFMILCLKVISSNVAIKSLGIPLQPLLDFLKEIYKLMQSDPKSHQNIPNLIDNPQALHYLIHAGNIKKYFIEAEIFGLIISCIVINYNKT